MQITTDGPRAYREAVGEAFDTAGFAQLHKVYGTDPKLRGDERRYSPAVYTSTQVTVISGGPATGGGRHRTPLDTCRDRGSLLD